MHDSVQNLSKHVPVEHEADCSAQEWVSAHEEDELEVGKADPDGRQPLEQDHVELNKESYGGQDERG
jgi:hypothetical protein